MNELINVHDLFHLGTLVVAVAVLKNDMRWVKDSIRELKVAFEKHEKEDTDRFGKVDEDARKERHRVNQELHTQGIQIAVLRAKKGRAQGIRGDSRDE